MRANVTIIPLLVNQTEGSSFRLTCETTPSFPPPELTWFLNSQRLSSNNQLNISTRLQESPEGLSEAVSVLTVPSSLPSHSGNYTCEAEQRIPQLGRIIASITEQPASVLINGMDFDPNFKLNFDPNKF